MIGLLALALAVQTTQTPVSGPAPYHVIRRIPLAGEGGWDYLTVDTVAHRLYVSRGTHVAVIDLDRDSVVGDIPNTNGVHGIAFVRELNRGFTSNGRDTTVTIFDLKTLAPIAVVKVSGRNPDAITYDPASRRVFTFNGGGANATAIDPQSGAGRVDRSRWQAGERGVRRPRPHVRQHRRQERARGVRPQNAAPMVSWRSSIPTAAGCSEHCRSGAARMAPHSTRPGLAVSSNGEGTMTLVHEGSPDSFRVVATVPTQRGGRTIALDGRTHRL